MQQSGFLVLKKFEALYRQFAADPKFTLPIYALPLHGTGPERLAVRYHGIDREPIDAYTGGSLAQIRAAEILGDPRDQDFLFHSLDQAEDVLRWAEQESPGIYEIAWARMPGLGVEPPEGFARLGFDPACFPEAIFSTVCDCLCFPRWHGTDDEGVLFAVHFAKLNPHGLFEDPDSARAFLGHYHSFDWTEHNGEFDVAEVWGREEGRTPTPAGASI